MKQENTLWLLFDAYRARKQNVQGIEKRQKMRLAEMIAFARENSAYYRELYKGLPNQIKDVSLLPVTNKKELMANFNDFVTDPQVKLEEVQKFVDDPSLIGEYFLGKYTVATTSGTTGKHGIFLSDDRTFKVLAALTFRMMSSWLSFRDFLTIIKNRVKLAMVIAMGGHYASAIAAARLQKKGGNRFLVLHVNLPIKAMVEKLNQFQPVLVAPYASIGSLLATEQDERRLNIKPVILVLSAERLQEKEYERISKALNTKVYDSYAATECPFISYRCKAGWLHVNSDWVILEAVDEKYKPVIPGKASHTVLITNLANKIQPIIRYDLGDSVLIKPEPCTCGNPLPAIKVQGRSADLLAFIIENKKITIAPLAFSAIAAHINGIERFQLIQTEPNTLRLRLKTSNETNSKEVFDKVIGQIKLLLKENGLEQIKIEQGEEPPEPTKGGKYREVIPLKNT